MFKHYTHVIFDFDETLATLKIDWKIWQIGIRKIILKYDPEAKLQKTISSDEINSYVKKYGKSIRSELWTFSKEFETTSCLGIVVNNTTIALLKSIKKPTKSYIFSSNSREIITRYLVMLNIIDLFDKIITRDDVKYIKPNPYGFSLIYDGTTPLSNYVMIGDSASDSNFATNANIDYIDVRQVKL